MLGEVVEDILDCAVVGAGPAGLTAAIYLARFRRSFAIFDDSRSRADYIPVVRNYPGFPEGVSGPALLKLMRAQAAAYGAPPICGRVQSLSQRDGVFVLESDETQTRARRVILATGVIENEPALPACADAVRRGLVRICPICDGYEGAGKQIGVLGNSDHAAAEALFLRTFSDAVTLILVGEAGLAPERRRELAAAGIEVIESAISAVRLCKDEVSAFDLADQSMRSFDTVYSAFGVTPQYALADQLGARRDSDGRLYVSDHQETSVAGLFAAGDLVRGLNQITVAAGEAAMAATTVHNSLPANPA